MSVSPVRLAVAGARDIVTWGVEALVSDFPDRLQIVPLPRDVSDVEPDVVLFDAIALHGSDGHELDLLVKESASALLVLAREGRPDLTTLALARGADAWVSLEAPADEMVAAIEAAAASYDDDADPGTGNPPRLTIPADLRETAGLSEREAEMLGYILQDLRNAEIAERCFLSVNSVKTYIRGAYRKLGVNNRAQAVLWCVQHGVTHAHR
ncbi:response regulator transcription factor [Nocardioides ungokensis]